MKKYLFLLIFGLALFLRVYKLGSFPTGFLWDEAALGYNAFSILETGRDEYGKLLPIVFKSFGDYKPGFYVYLTVPSIVIFGLNEFGVRFPSALFGSLTILMVYLLIRGITPDKTRNNAEIFSLTAAFLLAISPWHINFSRGSWELNIMLFELITGFYFLTKYFNKQKNKFLFFSAFFLILTFLTYQSAKALTPLLLTGFLFFNRTLFLKIKKNIRIRYLSAIGGFFLLFNIWTIVSGSGGRIKVMSLLSYPRSSSETEMILNQDNRNFFLFNLFHSNPVFFPRLFLERYFNHFSGKFLFITGDWSNQRNGVLYQGQMYYLELIFLLIGLGYLFAKKRNSLDNLMLFWLVLAPVPSALTRDSISSVRSYTMVIPLIYVVAVGISESLKWFSRFSPIIKYSFYILHFTFYICLFVRFADLYFIHDPRQTAENRLFGYKEAVENIIPLMQGRNKIIFSDFYGQPYIFYLFFGKYDPKVYQKKAILTENPYGDVGRVEKLDNFEFRKIYWPSDRGIKNSLFIGNEFDLPLWDIVGQENITFLKEIKYPNGKTMFRIVETK